MAYTGGERDQGTRELRLVDGDGNDATVLVDSINPVPGYYGHRWSAVQMWGRQPT